MFKIIKITKKKARYLGLSLIGLLITVAIISALAALSVPNILELRMKANEAWAIATLMKLASAFDTYRAINNRYPPDFATLRIVNPPLIDEQLANTGQKEGYRFLIDGFEPPTSHSFNIYAGPLKKKVTGVRWFKIDQSGTVYVATSIVYDTITEAALDPSSSSLFSGDWVPLQ